MEAKKKLGWRQMYLVSVEKWFVCGILLDYEGKGWKREERGMAERGKREGKGRGGRRDDGKKGRYERDE